MSFNVGGLYVKAKKGVTLAAVAKAITAAWTARGAKVDKRDPKQLESLGLEKTKRLGYAIIDTGDWIVVGESEQYTFDHAVAAHVATTLRADCLWYVLYGATDNGSAQRWGKQAASVSGYGEVEELLEDLPLAAQRYPELAELDDVEELEGDVTLLGFTVDPKKYDHGPIAEDDEPDDPPAKAPKKPSKTSGAAPFEVVRVNDGKDLMLRDGFLLAWFLKGSIAKTRKSIAAALDRYVAFIPPDMLRWSLLGSNSTTVRAFNSSTVSRAHGMLKKKDAYFWLGSDDAPETGKPQKDEPHCPAFLVHLNTDDEDPTGTLEMRFASDFVWQVGVDAFVAFAAEITKELPIHSGYGSLELAMHPMITSFSSKQRHAAMPIALAHPGFDLGNNDSTNYVLGARCRGARWLTILGPDLAAKVKPALAKTGAELIPCRQNLIVRAGAEPHPDPDPALIGKVAKALVPVSLLDDSFLAAWFEDPKTGERDPVSYATWEFRFMGGLAGAIEYLDAQKDAASKQRLLAIRLAQGDYAAAKKAFDVAAKGVKDSELGTHLHALSKLAEANKKLDDALAWMLRFRDSNKSNHWSMWALGQLYERLGKQREADEQFAAYKKATGRE